MTPEAAGDKYATRRYDVADASAIDAAALERLPFEHPGSATTVSYETEEFTSVCPWTGLPDFARVVITYQPRRWLVEMKSLKYYLTSYRSVGILQEHAVNRILEDMVKLLEPASLRVEAWFNERGGLRTHAVAEHKGREEPTS
ncbi:MAG: NADPH-dependent 7-cyano-7-deazaguanine reductase QueF [Chloroflexi bacterium]|nr:NADPH-dependent 7-cyano-7-deazaguanine reductase QueF [Chloroflexota bacterium]